MILTESNFQREFVMEASRIYDNHLNLIKVETIEEGEVDGMNSIGLEEQHLGCEQGEALVQWVVEMKEEVELQSVEENDPLCLPQSDQDPDGDFGGRSCSRKQSRKVERQGSSEAKVTGISICHFPAFLVTTKN